MEFVNVVDEKGRFVKLKVFNTHKTGQMDSDTHSYLYERDMKEREMGYIMGLDKLLPRCGHCKNIRIDGEWISNQDSFYKACVKRYKDRISHTICPSCAQEFYSDL